MNPKSFLLLKSCFLDFPKNPSCADFPWTKSFFPIPKSFLQVIRALVQVLKSSFSVDYPIHSSCVRIIQVLIPVQPVIRALNSDISGVLTPVYVRNGEWVNSPWFYSSLDFEKERKEIKHVSWIRNGNIFRQSSLHSNLDGAGIHKWRHTRLSTFVTLNIVVGNMAILAWQGEGINVASYSIFHTD